MASDDDTPEAVPISASAEEEQPATRSPVPVTLITGFLGAGKTTLVRHILSAPHGMRIAVILNEFGEGVEDAYYQDIKGLKNAEGEWVELDNGCMCCSVKSEFVQALEALLAKERKPEYILIETTGMANPGPVASALWTDDEVEAGVQLDSIITVVDAINIDRQLNAPRSESSINEAQVQVAYADLILLNKMDLCQEEAIQRAEADIRAINSSVHIIRTTNCTVDLNVLLNRNGYKHGAEIMLAPIAEDGDEEAVDEGDEEGGPGEPSCASGQGLPLTAATLHGFSSSSHLEGYPSQRLGLARSSVGGLSSHSRAVSLNLEPLSTGDPETGCGASHAHHDPEIQTVMLTADAPLVLEKVRAFMDKLLWDREAQAEDIYRAKGVLSIQGDDKKHMLQAVYELYNISPSVTWQPDEKRVTRVVIIGRQLHRSTLQTWWAEVAGGAPA